MKLERLFDMGSGYVLHFSNRTFKEFILDATYKNIYDDVYSFNGDSKANRLRAFWQIEPNHTVSKVIQLLLEHIKEIWSRRDEAIEPKTQTLLEDCARIAERLNQDFLDEHIETILQTESEDKDFSLLAKNIRETIEKNEPEVALDRLHTYVVKYVRKLCDKHDIQYDRNKPLHSCFGVYIKFLRNNDLIESEMTERILKYAISILDAFNFVRNNKSFAHDNDILNYNESMLIFKNISSIIAFVESVESRADSLTRESQSKLWDEITF